MRIEGSENRNGKNIIVGEYIMPNIIEVTDFEALELEVYARLTENQLLNRHEPEKGIFIAESPLVIERALDIDVVLLTDACSNPLYRRAIRVSMGTVF